MWVYSVEKHFWTMALWQWTCYLCWKSVQWETLLWALNTAANRLILESMWHPVPCAKQETMMPWEWEQVIHMCICWCLFIDFVCTDTTSKIHVLCEHSRMVMYRRSALDKTNFLLSSFLRSVELMAVMISWCPHQYTAHTDKDTQENTLGTFSSI